MAATTGVPAASSVRRLAGQAFNAADRSFLRPVLRSRRVEDVRFSVTAGRHTVDVGGLRLAVPDRFLDAYATGEFEPLTVEWLRAHVRPGMVAVDVGAHIGFLTLTLAALVGATGRVYALEPVPESLRYLRANVRLNRARMVTVVAAAAGPAAATRTLQLTKSSDCAGFYPHPFNRTVGTTEVRQVTVDSVVGRADVVKIDVEGAELEVLAGMPRLLADPAVTLLVEWFPGGQTAIGRDIDELPRALSAMGFTLTVLDDGARRTRTVEEVLAHAATGTLADKWYANLACRRQVG